MKIKVEEKGIRIDKYLAENTQYSRSVISKMISEDLITVNNNTVKPNFKLNIDDEINIVGEITKETYDLIAQDLDLEIVYEDDDVIVVNKPSNMVVHPAPGHPDKTLVNGLMYHSKALSKNDIRPGIVHRIDKDTSGLLMVAKNDKAHEFLAAQLKDKSSIRKYVAIVHGVINEDEATIDAPIGRDKVNRQKMAITDQNSKEAVTHIKVLERFLNYTLIECELETGRTHQIRVHLQYIKHPVVGDPVYGLKKTIDTKGQALHAKTLGFVHPTTNELMVFNADLPEEFKETIQKIKDTNVYR